MVTTLKELPLLCLTYLFVGVCGGGGGGDAGIRQWEIWYAFFVYYGKLLLKGP